MLRNPVFVSVFIALTAIQPCEAQQQSQSAQAPIGQPSGGPLLDGFVLTLTADSTPAHLHGPIWVDAELRNVSGQAQTGWFGPRYLYEFEIKGATGAIVPRNLNATFGFDPYMHDYTVQPNGTMARRFRLDLMYSFSSPGTYTVQITRAFAKIGNMAPPLKSNTIAITVLP